MSSAYNDLKSLTKKELLEALKEARQEMVQKRLTVKTKHDKNTSQIKNHKKYIARLLTALKEIEVEELIEKSAQID